MKTLDPGIPRSARSIAVAVLLGAIAAQGAGGLPRARAAGLLFADGGLGGTLEVKEHSVRVTISEGIAVTRVRQVFLNKEDRQVEALYTFPVPRGASVSNFSMWVGGKEMVGEVLRKERAREIYDSYRSVRRDPGLLEQVDHRTFELRIFPIEPGAEARIEVAYYQELDFDHDRATYVYPLASSTRRDLAARTAGRFSLWLEAKSEIPIAELESPSHRAEFAVVKRSERFYEASLEARGGDLGRDVVLSYRLESPETGLRLVTSKAEGDDGYFALTVTAGDELSGESRGMDYVFVVDVSGSMGEGGKLDVARETIGAFVKALGGDDRFEILTFHIEARALFGELAPVREESVQRAEAFLSSQRSRGGTVLKPAVEAAYRYAVAERLLNVVIVSDGLTEQTERSVLAKLIRARPYGTRVFSIGVGNDVDRALLESVAEESGGLAAFLSREDDLSRRMESLRRKLLRPAATDLAIEFRGVDARGIEVRDIEPKSLPNLYHGSPLRVYGRYAGSGPATIVLKGKVGGEEIEKALEVQFPDEDASHPEIERMWAEKRIARLAKEADAEGARPRVVDEIVRLGELYSIASEHTSFIVLENDAEYRRWKIERRNLLRLARDRASQEALARRLDAIRSMVEDRVGPAPVLTASAKPAAPSAPPTAGSDSGNGGGALDPISGGAALALAGLGLLARRRKRARPGEGPSAGGPVG